MPTASKRCGARLIPITANEQSKPATYVQVHHLTYTAVEISSVSLVNDMLRDLNRRAPVSDQAARVNNAIRARHSSSDKSSGRLLMVLALLLVVLLGGYLYMDRTGLLPAGASPPEVGAQARESAEPLALATGIIVEPAPPQPMAAPVVSIVEEAWSAQGFTLRLAASERVGFSVLERRTHGLTLQLAQVTSYERGALNIDGMSVLLTAAGLNVEFDLNRPVDFSVYEDGSTEHFDILLIASYRSMPPAAAVAQPAPSVVATLMDNRVIAAPRMGSLPLYSDGAAQLPAGIATSAPLAPSALAELPVLEAPALPRGQQSSVRINRELTLAQQDRNNSQAAVTLLQGGRLLEAYERLLVFLGEHPAAHQSRETLATLLLAQHDLGQAESIVDDGLVLAPNYSAFKKIKARLLMQKADMAQAMQLLSTVPPLVSDDPEYHELLASLYQQNSQHAKAVLSYQALLRIDSKQGRWWTGLGISLEAQGSAKEALASYQAAMQTTNLDAGLRQYSQARLQHLGQQQ